ncbi:MAG: carbohydrate ABC transporter permease [Acholeplasmataceae bacterium]|jgi:raffinose/stachyose/melibiose transport system permease protein/N-acetylglucosamine transport system permease protein|nr:carbohydrate ABC transporter permease [Acholeplasmataceae bacterium]
MRRKLLDKKSLVILRYVVFIIFAIYAFTLIFPFAWMFINSLKTNQEFFTNIWALPKKLNFGNYVRVVTDFSVTRPTGTFNIIHMFLISIFVTIVGTVLNLFISASAAYVIAKYKFPGSTFIYSLAVFVLIVPVVGTLPSQYLLMQRLGLYNTFLGLFVLYSGGFGFNFLLLYGAFKNISWTYAEAAFMDGAGDFTVFFKVMLPLAKPTITALSVIHAIGVWNDYVTPSIYLKNYPTLAVGLRHLTATMLARGAYAEMFASMIVAVLPIIIVFVIFQKTIMENTIVGGLKG